MNKHIRMILKNMLPLSKENPLEIHINISNSPHNINNLKVGLLQQFLILNHYQLMSMKHTQMVNDMLERKKME